MLDHKRKAQQEKEQMKLDAIEAKIENARKRLEEKKKVKSQNAKNTVKRRTAPASNSQQQNKYSYLNDSGNELEDDNSEVYQNYVGNRGSNMAQHRFKEPIGSK